MLSSKFVIVFFSLFGVISSIYSQTVISESEEKCRIVECANQKKTTVILFREEIKNKTTSYHMSKNYQIFKYSIAT